MVNNVSLGSVTKKTKQKVKQLYVYSLKNSI
jgi:hypothetical protein